MCYGVKQVSDLGVLLRRFKAKKGIQSVVDLAFGEEVTGFIAKNETEGKKVRVITNEFPEDIQVFRWGLIPAYAEDMKIEGFHLNAKLETLEEKVTYKDSIDNRCLILVDGFYEYQHRGNEKLKHLVTSADGQPFAFAGIWREAIAPTGDLVQSCALVTTEAKGIMREVHNSALRMPLVLKPGIERDWLNMNLNDFRSDLDKKLMVDLIATPTRAYQGDLFG